jgi:hypothetical protein
MKLVEITETDGKTLLINPRYVISVQPGGDEGTTVVKVAEHGDLTSKESLKAIGRRINKALRPL